MSSNANDQIILRELKEFKRSGVEDWEAIQKLGTQPKLQRILSRMNKAQKKRLVDQVYSAPASAGGGGVLPSSGPKVKNKNLTITTESSLNEFESAVDEGLLEAVRTFSKWKFAVVMLYQFFLSFGVDLDFMALILLIMDGLTATNVIVQIFSIYALISYVVAFFAMCYKVCQKWDQEPRALGDGQVETKFKLYHVIPLTRVIGFITMYSVEGGEQKRTHDFDEEEDEDVPQSAVDKLSHFNTMIIVNMLSTLTVSIPTLFIGSSKFAEGGMSTSEIVMASFALFQAGTSLTISFISMTLPGWTKICIDIVAEADKLQEMKTKDKENRIQLNKYYSKLRGILQNLVMNLREKNSTPRQMLSEVRTQHNQLKRTYDKNDPVLIEKDIMKLLDPISTCDPLNPELEDLLQNLLTDVSVNLRTVNQKVIEQKVILGYSLSKGEEAFRKENERLREEALMY